MTTHKVEAKAIFLQLHQLNTRLYAQVDVTTKTAVQEKAWNIANTIRQTAEFLVSFSKEYMSLQESYNKYKRAADTALEELEQKLAITYSVAISQIERVQIIENKLEQLQLEGDGLDTIKYEALAKLKDKLTLLLNEVDNFKDEQAKYDKIKEKICLEWNKVITIVNNEFKDQKNISELTDITVITAMPTPLAEL